MMTEAELKHLEDRTLDSDEIRARDEAIDALVAEVRRLKKAMRQAMSDMPSDQSRGYETLSLALGEP